MLTEEQKRKARKDEVSTSFQKMKLNEGGPVTFHYVEEITVKKNKVKKVSYAKKVVNIQAQALENRSVYDFMLLLKSMQHDFKADYFTF